MNRVLNYSCLFPLLLLINIVNGLYFHIGETERKCFIEEIPDETNVIGNIILIELNNLIRYFFCSEL